jgi:hypothetical protein
MPAFTQVITPESIIQGIKYGIISDSIASSIKEPSMGHGFTGRPPKLDRIPGQWNLFAPAGFFILRPGSIGVDIYVAGIVGLVH